MDIATNKLINMLSEAFDCGYIGTAEQREEVISEILEKHKIKKEDDFMLVPQPVKDEDFRVYHISELHEMPVGAVFSHSTLGKCRIAQRGNNKYMAFDNPGLAPSGFNVDGYPWETPMKRLE
jgi:hypothetical protein